MRVHVFLESNEYKSIERRLCVHTVCNNICSAISLKLNRPQQRGTNALNANQKAFAANRVPGEEDTLYYYTVIATMLSISMFKGTKPLFLFIDQLTEMI